MAKDSRDKHTIDGVPKKIGRPALDPEKGPMSGAEYQRKHRAGKASIQVLITLEEDNKLKKYCKKYRVRKSAVIRAMIEKLRMTTPPDA